MRQTSFFITGTDTGIGKTWASLSLMRAYRAQGRSVAGMKPVATGGVWRGGRLENEDALALLEAASAPLPYERVNPYVYEPPVSPHIAAAQAGRPIDLERIVKLFNGLAEEFDCLLVEGVGGWAVPLSDRLRVSDLALALGLPVILVVGLRLGCLNHALLTRAALDASGARFAGWIANRVCADFLCAEENIATLAGEWGVPPLAILPRGGAYPPQFHGPLPGLGPDEALRERGS
jgi:dethiobiotin synthetase